MTLSIKPSWGATSRKMRRERSSVDNLAITLLRQRMQKMASLTRMRRYNQPGGAGCGDDQAP
jgi:hypothetical protein